MSSLFESTTLGPMDLKNRLWRSATWENKADEKGHLTPELIEVYEELARGGVGTIVTGYAFVREEEQPNPGMMGIYDDRFKNASGRARPAQYMAKRIPGPPALRGVQQVLGAGYQQVYPQPLSRRGRSDATGERS